MKLSKGYVEMCSARRALPFYVCKGNSSLKASLEKEVKDLRAGRKLREMASQLSTSDLMENRYEIYDQHQAEIAYKGFNLNEEKK